jgi:outer membrane receptor for ferrienterochelin and colicin
VHVTKRLWLCLGVVFANATFSSAQTQITTGVIQGTLADPSGAVIEAAQIEVRNLDTNFTRSLPSDGAGRFTFLQLPPGRYSVTARKAGFATLVQEGLNLSVGQALSLALTMKVSSLDETVTVTGTATVDKTRTEVSNTLNETTIATTPVLGRKFEDLLTLTPGVSIVQGPDGDEITVAGQRGIFNNISLDGGDYNNGFFGEQVGGQRAAIDITMEAVKEFQVVATGANAEFGRTAGAVINVITKSGTNDLRGSLFHFQRLEDLTSAASDGSKLQDFHREQFGGTLGGPIRKDKAFFFLALEHINEKFVRSNLSLPLGSCPVAAPIVPRDQALIDSNTECQRLALLNFLRSSRNQEEGQPIDHTINNTAALAKLDWLLSPRNTLAISYNFDYSKNVNQTFDVATYGNSANGIEGPSRINVLNLNLFSTVSSTKLNEFHFTYSREKRPRSAVQSSVPADTAMGFATTFRFGEPFFLNPDIDELIWRTQVKNNFSIVKGSHTIKLGGEWLHTLNDQVFRGFFHGRYIFDSVVGFLRYAARPAAGGFGPNTLACSNGAYVTAPAACPAGSTPTGGPLLLYLQGAGLSGPATDAAGASRITNDEFAAFVQDKWQVSRTLTLNYGLRWDAQLMPETVDPRTTAYGRFLNDSRFPSDGTIPDQKAQFQPRFGLAWDVRGDGKSVVRANAGVYYARQNMLSQVGSVTTNGLQQQTLFVNSELRRLFGAATPTWPGLLPVTPVPAGQFPLFTGVRVFHRDYRNPRIYSANAAYERELHPDWSAYVDFTWAKGVHLTRFLDYNRADRGAPFSPQLGEVMVANSRGKSLYRGGTLGVRKRFSNRYQLEANYVLSKDMDDDSNERDPFTDRSFHPTDLSRDYALSDRDIRHKFNFYGYAELPLGLYGNARLQARSAQPITPSPRVQGGRDLGRNTLRKDNAFFSLDWRLWRPFKLGARAQLIPTVEMFNTFNNENNINPLTTPGLFNFDGFLRQGVGDPRQVQLALKLTF